MATKPSIAVEPRPDGRWAVQKDRTTRASRLFDRKQDAVDRARAQARREGAELVVKDQQGRIQSKDSHGRDDPRKRGPTRSIDHRAGACAHQLRRGSHYYASMLIASGCNVKQVQRVMGHELAMVTLDTYGHWWPENEDEIWQAVESTFATDSGDEQPASDLGGVGS